MTGKLRRRQTAENDDQRDEEQRHRIGGFGALQRGPSPDRPASGGRLRRIARSATNFVLSIPGGRSSPRAVPAMMHVCATVQRTSGMSLRSDI